VTAAPPIDAAGAPIRSLAELHNIYEARRWLFHLG
jgi:hypothetical protein